MDKIYDAFEKPLQITPTLFYSAASGSDATSAPPHIFNPNINPFPSLLKKP